MAESNENELFNQFDTICDNINFIKPEQNNELITKLKERTGLDIKRIVINDIDFIKESCAITVYYIEKN